MHLVYFGDPLCSWCYGFEPELAKLAARHADARVDLVMGGLRPFNREPMSEEFRAMLRGHWAHVADASGLPFSDAALERPGFTYDTEPACRAVVTARHLDAANSLACMTAIQSAFYRDGRDATSPEVLADIAADIGYDRVTFHALLESDAMRSRAKADFARSQSCGVSGFPTLAVALGADLYLVTSGFTTAAVLEERLAEIERRAAGRS